MGMMQQMMQWANSKGMGKGMGKGPGGRDSGGPEGSRPGDWICPQCKNVNFSNRDKCNKCGASGRGEKRLGMKPGDWICPNCGDLVFASKSACKMCSTPKPLTEGEGGAYVTGSYGAASATPHRSG